MYKVIERKTEAVIEEVLTIEEGENLISLIEKHAKEDKTFTENAFAIIDKSGKEVTR